MFTNTPKINSIFNQKINLLLNQKMYGINTHNLTNILINIIYESIIIVYALSFGLGVIMIE